jgi:hypothetical protein
LAKRNYFNGLVVGGVLGALLGAIYISRQDSNRIITKQSRQIGNNAKRVLRGISRGMLEMTRR